MLFLLFVLLFSRTGSESFVGELLPNPNLMTLLGISFVCSFVFILCFVYFTRKH